MLQTVDDVKRIVAEHNRWRSGCLNLVASENIASASARQFLASDFGSRYGTYYDDPAVRNYRGNRYMAALEIEALELAKKLFRADYVDLRPLGGQMAGVSVISALTKPGDTVYEVSEFYHGHKTATKMVSAGILEKALDVKYIPFDPDEYNVDVDAFITEIRKTRPKLIIFGFSSMLFPEPIEEVVPVAKEIGSYIAMDGSHVMGLIAAGVFPNPLDQGADVLLGSHHKTYPGPQGGLIAARNVDLWRTIRKALYTPLVTNHHMARIPALAVSFLEMLKFGPDYGRQIVGNSQALGKALTELGFTVMGAKKGYSHSHIVMIDVARFGGAAKVTDILESANIISCKAELPGDMSSCGKTVSGIRVGTQEATRIGMKEDDMKTIAGFLKMLLMDGEKPAKVAEDVTRFVSTFKEIHYCFDVGIMPYQFLF